MKRKVLFVVIVAVTTLVLLFFMPVINFGLAYLAGWILEVFIGDTVANGLNTMFNTDRFSADILPLFCGALGLIGSAFKSTNIDSIVPLEVFDDEDDSAGK